MVLERAIDSTFGQEKDTQLVSRTSCEKKSAFLKLRSGHSFYLPSFFPIILLQTNYLHTIVLKVKIPLWFLSSCLFPYPFNRFN